MNPALGDKGGAARHRHRTVSGPVIADSGLRLLIGGPLRRQLRWSPDPDAPDARALLPGELRLAIHWVEISAHDLRLLCGAATRRAHHESAAWQPVAATGCGQVIESTVPGCRRGRWLSGPLHLGTHRVLRVAAMDGAACLATHPEGDPATKGSRYAWSSAPPAGPVASGQDAVEQAVLALRDSGAADRLRLSLNAAIHVDGRCKSRRPGYSQGLNGRGHPPGLSQAGR